jgi:hypothetical protein
MPSHTPEQLLLAAQIAELMSKQTGQKHDLTPAAGVAPYAHGTGGLFATPGVDMNIFSAMMLPDTGLLDALPVQPPGTSLAPDSDYGGFDTPFYDTVTGVTAGDLDAWANQPNAPCDDPPAPGLLKLCTLTAPYGRFYGSIRAVDLQRVARLTHRHEPTDLVVRNDPADAGGFLTPTPLGGGTLNSPHTRELNVRLFEAATSFKRMIAPLVYTGDPTNNMAGGGARQFSGFDILINENNKVDAFTSSVCTALNSDIKDFGFDLVNGAGRDIAEYIDTMFYYLSFNAQRQGLAPVELVLVMRPELFDEITKVWVVRYYQEVLTDIGNFTNGRAVLDARDQTTMRDQLRNERFLPIRGQRVRVILDDTIAEDTNITNANLALGQYASDIYFVPMTVLGGVPVTYLEAFNYNNGNVRAFTDFLGINTSDFNTSDAGRFLWWSAYTNTCLEYRWLTEFRAIMRTPQLAGRIQNVAYEPLQHTRSWDTDSAYFFDGGRTNTLINSYYTEYSTSTPVQIG